MQANGQAVKRPKRWMIVDDDLEVSKMTQIVMNVPNDEEFYTVMTSGLVALKFLNDVNYDMDAVILDLSMPDKDGLTLTREIREQENLRSKVNPIRIFWWSAWPIDDNDTMMTAKRNYGVTKVFQKPQDDIAYVIRNVRECIECTARNC